MDVAHQLVTIFVEVDDFCKQLAEYHYHGRLLLDQSKGRPRGPSCSLTDSEIMTILLTFQRMKFRHFKSFYEFILTHYSCYFPEIVSYHRFLELMSRVIFPLTIFTQLKSGAKTGIYYIDSSCLPVCLLARSRRHKTFESVSEYGKTSVGWFFGLKLHIVINHLGEIIAFKITKGNKHDASVATSLLSSLDGKAFGDKGYLGKKIFDELLNMGIKLITRKRKNMKKTDDLSKMEKQLLDQRGIIETEPVIYFV